MEMELVHLLQSEKKTKERGEERDVEHKGVEDIREQRRDEKQMK